MAVIMQVAWEHIYRRRFHIVDKELNALDINHPEEKHNLSSTVRHMNKCSHQRITL